MVIGGFSLGNLPRIEFGDGTFEKVPDLVAARGARALLVTGQRSFAASARWPNLLSALTARGLTPEHLPIEGEPSPATVDAAVRRFRPAGIHVVLAVGGGSVVDAGKAIAALLPHGYSVVDHLEGVGRNIPYAGPSLPCIAVPTTAGTGSEATRNAVLSTRGPGGFKRSFRHDALMPVQAVVDPDLLVSCPRETIAASGTDAVTQLLESFVSLRAGAFTDALAEHGLAAAREGLLSWYEGGENSAFGRRAMAYAALLSGICLSHAGLGAVHGLSSPLGAFFPVPHGAVCGTLLAAVTRANLEAMRAREPANPALPKYARAGSILAGAGGIEGDPSEALVRILEQWTERLGLPRLGAYGIRPADLDAVVRESRPGSMRTNPIVLSDAELRDVLESRL